VTRLAGVSLATALALAACGVKAPPRPSGAPDKAPPNAVFIPAAEPNGPSPELPAAAEEPAR
jgi:hypothetical protein